MDKSVKFRIELETRGEKVLRTISVDTNELRSALKGVQSELGNVSDKLGDMAKAGLVFTAVTDAVKALEGAVGGIAGDYDSFDKGMRAASSIAGESAKNIGELKEEVKAIADVVPLAKEELANGLYQVISNGVPKDNWIEFLEKSSRSAVGGIADLGQTVTVTSTIIKNYGMAWDAAGDIQDKIQMTAKNGVTTFGQLGEALPKVTGSAATLNVEIDELLASFATLTGVSGNTAEVSTQLAAIFNALIRPTSEAAEMAETMGMKFDASAIKAAGGLQNFFEILKKNVEEYASASGMLEQEIYGRLFGSAEALRAILPITSELADKYTSNVEAMANSGGTIDAAFDHMSGSGDAVTQMLKNQMSSMLEWAGSVASSISPYLSFIAVGGQAIYGLGMMSKALKVATNATLALIAAQKSNVVVSTLAAMHEKIQCFALNLLTASSYTATAGTWALTAAVTALYAAATLGASVIITGLVSLFSDTGEEAAGAADNVDLLKESTDAMKHSASNAKAAIDMEITSLRKLIKEHGNDKDAVDKLNHKYGDALGYHKTASEWYDTLITKSKAYCQQLGYEAQAKVLASQIAAKEIERDAKLDEYRRLTAPQLDKDGKSTNQAVKEGKDEEYVQGLAQEANALSSEIESLKKNYSSAINKMAEAGEELKQTLSDTSAEISWQKQNYESLGKTIEKQKQKVASLAGVDDASAKKEAANLKQMEARYNALGKKYGLISSSPSGNSTGDKYDGKELIEKAKSYKELSNNISYYQEQIEKTDASDKDSIKTLQGKINALEEERDAIKAVMDAAGRPVSLDTLEDIDKEIAYQQGLKQKASADNISGIEAEISRLKELKRTLEESAHKTVSLEKIATYEELENEIATYENKLKHATQAERVEISSQINALKKLRREWDSMLSALNVPDDIGHLNTMDDLQRAISYYDERIKQASRNEIEGLQKTKALLEEKHKSLERLTELPSMEKELGDLEGLGHTELKLELDLIGLDGVKNKIRSLQKMLDDTKNPLNADQRKEVTLLINSWKGYEKQMRRNKVTVRDSWSNIRGLGDSISGITETLKGNGNAWDKVTGTIDGMLGVYDSVKGIISIVEMLTGVTNTHTAAKTAEAAATISSTTAETSGAATSELAATAQLPAIAANKAATASYMELAAAAYFAAHAYIPFAGYGIASGFASAAVAETQAIAAMPFADGGVIYGPTLGLMGEYAGAKNNPEVVAPLNKLKNLIGENSEMASSKVEFKIRGRVLAGILEKENLHRRRH